MCANSDKSTTHVKMQVHKNHSEIDVIDSLNIQVTRNKQLSFKERVWYSCFVSLVEPNDIKGALEDEFWYGACHKEN